jgi:hypothetical protein
MLDFVLLLFLYLQMDVQRTVLGMLTVLLHKNVVKLIVEEQHVKKQSKILVRLLRLLLPVQKKIVLRYMVLLFVLTPVPVGPYLVLTVRMLMESVYGNPKLALLLLLFMMDIVLL